MLDRIFTVWWTRKWKHTELTDRSYWIKLVICISSTLLWLFNTVPHTYFYSTWLSNNIQHYTKFCSQSRIFKCMYVSKWFYVPDPCMWSTLFYIKTTRWLITNRGRKSWHRRRLYPVSKRPKFRKFRSVSHYDNIWLYWPWEWEITWPLIAVHIRP